MLEGRGRERERRLLEGRGGERGEIARGTRERERGGRLLEGRGGEREGGDC